jgi:succinoglycan biosynthesis protein ExoM
MLVNICIITYQRPEGIQRLISGLNQLTFDRIQCPDIQIVLVDNDASGVAAFHENLRTTCKWPLRIETESRRGISYARNRAIASANPESDFIAFIDDDEVPSPIWLEELLVVQKEYNADVVHGRVAPHFQEAVPAWVKKGNFFETCRYPTGHRLEAAYTNNVLVRTALLKHRDQVFDERFALTGGEDSYFFRTLHHQGHSLIWADDAVVYEWIPPSRTTMKWILLRAYRGCLTYTIWEKEVKASLAVKMLSSLKAIAQIGLGALLLLPSLVLERQFLVKALLRICKGSGKLSAFLGLRYEEYKTIHGA